MDDPRDTAWRYRARVYLRGQTVHYEVRNLHTGDVMVADNTRRDLWGAMHDKARLDVYSFQRVTGVGYRLAPKNWNELLDEVVL